MAIDTATKRASALTYAMAPILLPIPNSTITQDDRQTLLGIYGGILAAAAAVLERLHDRISISLEHIGF